MTTEPDHIAMHLARLGELLDRARDDYDNPDDYGHLALKGAAMLIHRHAIELRMMLGDQPTRRTRVTVGPIRHNGPLRGTT